MEGALQCKKLCHLDVGLNLGMNNCMEELLKFISTPSNLVHLNISDLKMNDENQKSLVKALIDSFNVKWNLGSNIRNLIWNNGLTLANAKHFKAELDKVYNNQLKLEMKGVFNAKTKKQI